MSFSCPAAGTTIVLDNINVSGTITASTECTLEMSGTSYAERIDGGLIDESNQAIGSFISEVRLGPGVSVDIDDISNVESIVMVSTSDLISNLSVVPGDDVTDALDRIGSTKITVPSFSAKQDGSGIQESKKEISREPASSNDEYDLYSQLKTVASAVNDTFYRKGSDAELSSASVTGDVSAGSVETTSVKTQKVELGDSVLEIDSEGYLVS